MRVCTYVHAYLLAYCAGSMISECVWDGAPHALYVKIWSALGKGVLARAEAYSRCGPSIDLLPRQRRMLDGRADPY